MGVAPSQLDVTYWQYTLKDLRLLVRLKMEHDMAKSLSFAESLNWVAASIFGKKKPETKTVSTIDQMMAIAREVNSGGR